MKEIEDLMQQLDEIVKRVDQIADQLAETLALWRAHGSIPEPIPLDELRRIALEDKGRPFE